MFSTPLGVSKTVIHYVHTALQRSSDYVAVVLIHLYLAVDVHPIFIRNLDRHLVLKVSDVSFLES